MNWLRIAEDSIAILGAVVAALVPLAPVVVPLVAAQIKDANTRRAFDAVTRAALLGANAALRSVNTALTIAKMPNSPGGSEVTDEEFKRAIKGGIIDARAWLKLHGLYDKIVAVYGGEDRLTEALHAAISHKLLGNRSTPGVAP